ncbi:MAG: hypothetical protein MK212_07930 [Saprospiraceae bacterium]|nr:hypothetical protein [Saprospiraceae bacterium]
MKQVIFFLCILFSLSAWGQTYQDATTHNIDMSGMIIYVLPFYLVTIGALYLFLLKLKNPKRLTKWIYVVYLIGIIGGGVVAWQFKQIEETQLPQADTTLSQKQIEEAMKLDKVELDEYQRDLLRSRERDASVRPFANFWIIGLPNVFFLIFSLYFDWKYRGQDEDEMKIAPSRYD